MRKILLALGFCVPFFAKAQTVVIPNGGFENWILSESFIQPTQPPPSVFSTSNYESFFQDSVLSVDTIYNGSGLSMYLESWATSNDTNMAFAAFGDVNDGQFDKGVVLNGTEMVTGIVFDSEYFIDSVSPGMALVLPKRNGNPAGTGDTTIPFPGSYILQFAGDKFVMGPDTLIFNPPLDSMPDEIIIAFASNDPFMGGAQPGDYLIVDNVSLLGTTQTVPNGDLESWAPVPPIEYPTPWEIETNFIDTSFLKTSDASEGMWALELRNVLESSGDVDVTRARIGDIDYDTSGNITNIQGALPIPGNPSSFQMDYKYLVDSLDSAQINMQFTKYYPVGDSTVSVGWMGTTIYPSVGWNQIFITAGGFSDDADHVTIEIYSSQDWSGASPNPGSRLIVDALKLNYCSDTIDIMGPNIVCNGQTGIEYRVDDTRAASVMGWNPQFGTPTTSVNEDSVLVDVTGTTDTIFVEYAYQDGCPTDTLWMNVTVQSASVADAGPDQVVCASNDVMLDGMSLAAPSGGWTSSGNGTFFPDSSDENATYMPSSADTAAGSVELIWTTSGGSCTVDMDTMTITFSPVPAVNAGPDEAICDTSDVIINGSVWNATGGMWSSSGIGPFGDPNALSTYYSPTGADASAGSVSLILTTTGTGVCPPVKDTLEVTITVCTGVSEAGSAVSIAPNPTSGSITVTGDGNIDVDVFDALGNSVASGSGNSSVGINLSTVESGVYFVSITSASGVEVKRVVKE